MYALNSFNTPSSCFIHYPEQSVQDTSSIPHSPWEGSFLCPAESRILSPVGWPCSIDTTPPSDIDLRTLESFPRGDELFESFYVPRETPHPRLRPTVVEALDDGTPRCTKESTVKSSKPRGEGEQNSTIFMKYWFEARLDELKSEKDELKGQNSRLQSTVCDLTGELAAEKVKAQTYQERLDELKSEKDELKGQNSRLQSTVCDLTGELAAEKVKAQTYQEQNARLEKDKSCSQFALDCKNQNNSSSEETCIAMKAHIGDIKSEKLMYQQSIGELKEKLKMAEKTVGELNSQSFRQNQLFAEQKMANFKLQSSLDSMTRQWNSAKSAIDEQQTHIGEQRELTSNLKQEISNCKDKLLRQNQKLHAAEEDKTTLQLRNSEMSDDIMRLEREKSELKVVVTRGEQYCKDLKKIIVDQLSQISKIETKNAELLKHVRKRSAMCEQMTSGNLDQEDASAALLRDSYAKAELLNENVGIASKAPATSMESIEFPSKNGHRCITHLPLTMTKDSCSQTAGQIKSMPASFAEPGALTTKLPTSCAIALGCYSDSTNRHPQSQQGNVERENILAEEPQDISSSVLNATGAEP